MESTSAQISVIFSEQKRNIKPHSSVEKVHAAGEAAIVERQTIFGESTVIERAVLETEARLFRRFKRLHYSSTAESTATNSQALNLLDEQYKTFEEHLHKFQAGNSFQNLPSSK